MVYFFQWQPNDICQPQQELLLQIFPLVLDRSIPFSDFTGTLQRQVYLLVLWLKNSTQISRSRNGWIADNLSGPEAVGVWQCPQATIRKISIFLVGTNFLRNGISWFIKHTVRSAMYLSLKSVFVSFKDSAYLLQKIMMSYIFKSHFW